MLSACSTVVPVTMKFPGVPDEIMVACPDLQQQEYTEKLSEVMITVSKNYSQYHECRAKVDAWVAWYNSQKQIYDSVK
jgi:alpha-L-arabinofuranosidase